MRPVLALTLLLALPILPAFAQENAAPASLRIGLDHSYRHATQLLVSCTQPFRLKDTLTNHPLAHGVKNTIFKLTVASDSITLAQVGDLKDTPLASSSTTMLTAIASADGFVAIARIDGRPANTKGILWHRYRGFLTIRKEADNSFRVINTVPLEPYLYGVISAEIGSNVPMEAMKAQAVAARTYALKNRGKCTADGFDLDDTTRCEGYLGVDGETADSNAAVDATRGQVLTYAGQLIDATYSTDSGGVTACDTSGECPYLQAVKDCDAKDGLDYAATGRYHAWSQTFTQLQIATLLAHDPLTRLDKFLSLTIDGLDASGRITTATVAGSDGTLKTVTGPQLRRILGYDALRSTRVVLTRTPSGDYQFEGKGWGHGMGMSQDGAVAMAGPPYRKTYRDILKHYYVGTQIATDTKVTVLQAQTTRHGF